MNVITNNQIVYDSGIIDEDYENAFGRRGQRRGLGRKGGRKGGRKRTGLNRAIGVIPIVAGARYLQRRKAEREDRERKEYKSSPRKSRRTISEEEMYQGRQSQRRTSNPNSDKSRPIPMAEPRRTNPLQGKPNSIQQDVAITNSPVPTISNSKNIALVVGGVLLLGVAAYFYSKRNK